MGDGALDVQTGSAAWRSVHDILDNGRCPGVGRWCDLQAKKDKVEPMGARAYDGSLQVRVGSLERLLGVLESVWWHAVSRTPDARLRESPDYIGLFDSRC